MTEVKKNDMSGRLTSQCGVESPRACKLLGDYDRVPLLLQSVFLMLGWHVSVPQLKHVETTCAPTTKEAQLSCQASAFKTLSAMSGARRNQ